MSGSVSTAGDLGDVVAGVCGVIQSLPGKHTVFLRDDGRTKGIVKRAAIITPLLEAQPYVGAVKVWKDEPVDWTSEDFRNGFHQMFSTLLSSHARHAESVGFISRIPKGDAPWITTDADKATAGRVVINRTARYQNPHFPWGKIVAHYGKRLLFVGTEDEHNMFCNIHGYVERKPTKNLLEVARLIAGSALFIGNQSVAMTIAEGLKHPRVMETCLEVCDCIYPGSQNAQYVADGSVTLPDIDGSGQLSIPSQAFKLGDIQHFHLPPGGWLYTSPETGPITGGLPRACAKQVVRKLGEGKMSLEEAERRIILQNVQREPRFFARHIKTPNFTRVKLALEAAGIASHPVFEIAKGNIQFDTSLCSA